MAAVVKNAKLALSYARGASLEGTPGIVWIQSCQDGSGVAASEVMPSGRRPIRGTFR